MSQLKFNSIQGHYPVKFFLLISFLLISARSFGQSPGNVSGTILDQSGSPIPGVSVSFKSIKKGTSTNEKGSYELQQLPEGKYQVIFSMIGYQSAVLEIQVKNGANIVRNLVMKSSAQQMKEVNVAGRSKTQQANRQAYQVTAIDAKQLHNTTLNLAKALDRVAGVRIRESGGVGSRTEFSLNGFSGNQVKFFIDGIPMDNFGSSFDINNIPVNLAERLEVYKGVVPVSLGSDALGGAVNIITNSGRSNYLDASYSYGSFNTHRSSVNAGYTTAKGIVLNLNAYQNYSDNDYWVNTETQVDQYGTIERVKARRFHDGYRNEMIRFSAGLKGKSWADMLTLGLDLGQNKADIQNGVVMGDVYGARRTSGTLVMPSLKYLKKNLGLKGLDLNVSGNFNLGHEKTIDTVNKQYNWLGQVVKDFSYGNPDIKGGERERMLYRYKNNNGIGTINLSYKLNDHHSFVINNTFNTFRRIGKDLLEEKDLYFERPQTTSKNVLGAAYRFDANERWNTTVFFKHYYQRSKAFINITGVDRPSNNDYGWSENNFSTTGYGLASTYFLGKDLQLRASYEHGVRVPESSELFGNVNTLTGNFSLKPESSENVNIGAIYTPAINNAHFFTIDAALLYRYSKDFIRPSLNAGNKYTLQRMVNLRDVDNTGIEANIRYRYKTAFNIGANVTYQNLRNQTKFEGGEGDKQSIIYGDRLPNMPYMYGNLDASYTFRNLMSKGDNLTVGYNLLYVHAYFEGWPSLGNKNEKYTIPEQYAHNANLLYSFAGGKYNLAMECLNLTDALLYDHYKLQKPSRSFNLKLRYFLFNKFK